VAAHVPEGGRVLEVGCGYGVFCCHLALGSRDRTVVGVDVDARKIVHAQRAARQAAARGAKVEFHLAPPGDVPDGPWDAVVIVDVLYLLDPDAQAGLLHTCAEQLGPGGVLVVKEMARTPTWKARWNRVQETLAVRLLRITAGDQLSFPDPDDLETWMTDAGLEVAQVPLHHRYPHPHHLLVGRRPTGLRLVDPDR
jgi:2-polyprenyl-3-methyl-5-hydroxy-6-metoxy-1,4-benzoquinol methylase